MAGGGGGGGGDEYAAGWVARALHAVPHLNVTLHRVNDTFAPRSPLYLESLGIIASVPGGWLIFTLLVLLFYLLTRCCDRKDRPKRSITALKISVMVMGVVCMGAVGLGLYANDELHQALVEAVRRGRQLAALLTTVHNQSALIEEALGSGARAPLTRLSDALDAPANPSAVGGLLRALASLRTEAAAAVAAADRLRAPLQHVRVDAWLQRLWAWEQWRWWGGMGAWCAMGAVCVALVAAGARGSRRALLALSVCALASLVACALASCVLAAAAVALADACQDPARALAAVAPPSPLPPDIVHYYLTCRVSRENALTAELRAGQRAVVGVRQALAVLGRDAPPLYPDPGLLPALGALSAGTGEAERALVALGGALDCRGARDAFAECARALCGPGLAALALQLLAATAAALLYTLIVLLDTHTWIYINTKGGGESEERAPFLSGSSGGSAGSAGRALPPPPQPYSNGNPPSYSAALHLSDMQRHRVRGGTLGRGVGGGAGANGVGAGVGLSGSATLGRASAGAGAAASHYGAGGAGAMGGAGAGGGGAPKYATLSKQCKTLESNDFY